MPVRQRRMGSPWIATLRPLIWRKYEAAARPVRARTNSGGVEKHLYEYSGGWAWLRNGYSWKVPRLEFRLDTVNDAAAFQAGIGHARPPLLPPSYPPLPPLPVKPHLT